MDDGCGGGGGGGGGDDSKKAGSMMIAFWDHLGNIKGFLSWI